ncbi:hypothetical protein TNCV_2812031 [Trichonephila clavipes]|nr:hypothetical protein TNCV_2812031 [Trichonephila clavipes]
MSKKINITEGASLSPMVYEPDSDEDLCETIPQLQRLRITEIEPSIYESDMADKVLTDSKDMQYYITHPSTEEASNDTIKSDEASLFASSEGVMTKDNQRLATIKNNEVDVEITEILSTIDEDSPTYYCPNFPIDEVQICETSIKKGIFNVKCKSSENANHALEEVEHCLSSKISYSRH